MRLQGPTAGHSTRTRLLHKVIRRVSGHPVPDVVRTLHYRPEFFGSSFSNWVEQALRGPSEWTQGDRELMAALVSARNQCVF
ncbi:MAG: hypothetical protein QOJ57_862 [Thermoleophilaceae bacterium]|nr:hypothetical protein [Thermoleophilaceae bacterium]